MKYLCACIPQIKQTVPESNVRERIHARHPYVRARKYAHIRKNRIQIRLIKYSMSSYQSPTSPYTHIHTRVRGHAHGTRAAPRKSYGSFAATRSPTGRQKNKAMAALMPMTRRTVTRTAMRAMNTATTSATLFWMMRQMKFWVRLVAPMQVQVAAAVVALLAVQAVAMEELVLAMKKSWTHQRRFGVPPECEKTQLSTWLQTLSHLRLHARNSRRGWSSMESQQAV